MCSAKPIELQIPEARQHPMCVAGKYQFSATLGDCEINSVAKVASGKNIFNCFPAAIIKSASFKLQLFEPLCKEMPKQ